MRLSFFLVGLLGVVSCDTPDDHSPQNSEVVSNDCIAFQSKYDTLFVCNHGGKIFFCADGKCVHTYTHPVEAGR